MEKKKSHAGRNAAIILLLVVILACAVMIYTLLAGYESGDSLYNSIAEIATSNMPNSDETNPAGLLGQINFDALRDMNPSVAGWLRLPGTVIDYPIAQADTNEYYLSHAFDGQDSNFGAIFLDYRNNPDFSDRNTVIYGHRMNNGSMFGSLLDYQSQEFYEQHPYLILYTPTQNYYIEVFSAYEVLYNDDYIRTQFAGNDEFAAFVDRLEEKSLIDTDVFVSRKDCIVTLSTCTKASDNHRFAVHGKLIPAEPE